MINPDTPDASAASDERIDRIVAGGPSGALTLAAIATAGIIAIWVAFYLFVFLARGALQ